MSYTSIDVYQKALGFIGELNDPMGNPDYESRAPYLLASFCSTAKSLDKRLRSINGLEAAPSFSPIYVSLMEYFPLCDELIHPAALYVASMLIVEDDSELSSTLYDQYCDSIATIAASIGSVSSPVAESPAVCESIVEKYFNY